MLLHSIHPHRPKESYSDPVLVMWFPRSNDARHDSGTAYEFRGYSISCISDDSLSNWNIPFAQFLMFLMLILSMWGGLSQKQIKMKTSSTCSDIQFVVLFSDNQMRNTSNYCPNLDQHSRYNDQREMSKDGWNVNKSATVLYAHSRKSAEDILIEGRKWKAKFQRIREHPQIHIQKNQWSFMKTPASRRLTQAMSNVHSARIDKRWHKFYRSNAERKSS